MTGRVPDRLTETLTRMVDLMKPPQSRYIVGNEHSWDPSREEPRVSHRLSADEVNILTEWLNLLEPIFNGRVKAKSEIGKAKSENRNRKKQKGKEHDPPTI